MDTTPPLIKLLIRLNESGVDFVISEGYALRLHGANPMTIDFTISFAQDVPNCEKLCALLNAHHVRPVDFPQDRLFTLTPALLLRVPSWQMKTDLCNIDLWSLPDGIDSYAGLRERAMVVDMDGLSVAVASIDDLIAMKQAANRPKDQLHIIELRAVQRVPGETAPPAA